MKLRDSLINTTILISAITPILTLIRPLGSFSLGGLASFGIFLASLLMVLFKKQKSNYAITLGAPLAILCTINILNSAIANSESPESNVSIFLWPAFTFLIIITSSVNNPESLSESLKKAMIAGTAIYIPSAFIIGIKTGHSPALALAGLPFYCFCLTNLSKKNKLYLAPLALILVSHALLSARIVIASELIISTFFFMLMRGGITTKPIYLITIATAGYIVISTSGIMSKTVSGGDNALEIGGVTLNTSGRLKMWEIILESSLKSPITGHGIAVPNEISHIPGWAHPHNDYLRLLHQTGITGLILWATFLIMAIARIKKSIQDEESKPRKTWHETSLLMLAALSLTMITDNSITYSYVLYPTAVLIGLSISLSNTKKKLEQKNRETNLETPLRA